ncbi:hypothetical protein Taro_002500 [Colocasia esculenta]|uniref:Uncharacterized protein n=1 Tax=Colocasia esculenta TaxID=4460 RepID=A0A843TCY3_COLES|nr:hypothetical protein [Colocasia esculenta]
MRDLLLRSWIWVPEHRRYSHPLLFIPTPSAKELGITFHTGIGIACVTTIRNRHSETVDKALVSRNSVQGPKSHPPRSVCTSTPIAVPTDSLDYANRWRSPHAEPHSHSDQKSCSTRREISSTGRGYGSDSLDYANRWRSPLAGPASHSDQKSCSTQLEISSSGRGYGCPNIADINRHSETVDKALVSRNSVPGPKFPPERVSYSLDYANPWRSPHAEPPSHSDQKSCSTRCEISSSGRGYGCQNIADINRHSETVDKALVLRNSVSGPKFSRSVCSSTPTDLPSGRTRIFILPGVGTAREAPIQNRHFDPNRHYESVDKALVSSDSLDYVNHWWSPHAEPPSHSDQKSCSTRHEISSSGRGYGCPNITDINRDSETVDKALVSRNSVLGQKFAPERVSESLDYANRWRSPHTEPPNHSDQKSCSTRCEISSSGHGYGCPNIADINRHSETVDKALVSRNFVPGQKFRPERRLPRLRESLAEPTRGAAQSQRSEVVFNSTRNLLLRSWIWVPEHRRYSHPLRFIANPSAKELGITFHMGIGIAYVTTIRNRHSEMVDRALISRNSIPGQKFPPERVY